jgi:phosphoribosyl-ATP pyrophosphohydrolase
MAKSKRPGGASTRHPFENLHRSVLAARKGDPAQSRTAKLFKDGIQKMAKKLAEEAVEVGLDAVRGNRDAIVLESADLLYNLCVLLVEMDIAPKDIWRELRRREKLMGIAEKLPKSPLKTPPKS